MTDIYIAWGISAGLLVALALVIGRLTPVGKWLGILVDDRYRFSLTHVQIVAWSIVILSLISGVFFGRLVAGVKDPLDFTIPGQVLGLLGISAGSAVTAISIKATKDPAKIGSEKPRFRQIFLAEEGAYADQVIDVTKYQNFIVTIVLVAAYVTLAIHAISDAGSAKAVTSLPDISGTFLILLGISHGAYLAAKAPSKPGDPVGETVAARREALAAAG
jgi:hypothetical protein